MGLRRVLVAGFLFWSIKHYILIVNGYVMYTDVCECYSHVLGEQLALGYIYPHVLTYYYKEHILLLTVLEENYCSDVALLWLITYKYECEEIVFERCITELYMKIVHPEHTISNLF